MSEEDKKDLLRRLEQLASSTQGLREAADQAVNTMSGIVHWCNTAPTPVPVRSTGS